MKLHFKINLTELCKIPFNLVLVSSKTDIPVSLSVMAGVVNDTFHIQTKEDHESKLAIAGNPFLLSLVNSCKVLSLLLFYMKYDS
jgi:isopentenyl diphosphate isomerase/L-lactate dehydrogenase-like FMN-dependent dehydrogenase